MLKSILVILAVFFAGMSLLTFLRAPDSMIAWQLAIVAGEFGHWLAVAVAVLAVTAVFASDGAGRAVTLALCCLAIVGFLNPAVSACRIAQILPGDLQAIFGGGNRSEMAFDWRRLYAGKSVPATRMTTEVFAQPNGQELKLDFYAPSGGQSGRAAPCLVVIHGGGWDGGDRTQLSRWNARFAARGYAVAAISYRLAPQSIWPAQKDDVLAAVAWLKANAGRLGLDPTRLVLLGRSAGGQLATAIGYGARDPAIRGVIALYAPHDMPFAWSVSREDDALNSIKLFKQYFGGPPDTPERQANYEAASGQLLARTDSPPTLLIHGIPDTLAWSRHSERLDGRLTALGVPHYYLMLPWATHGFDFNPDGPGGQLADYAIGQFLSALDDAPRPAPRI